MDTEGPQTMSRSAMGQISPQGMTLKDGTAGRLLAGNEERFSLIDIGAKNHCLLIPRIRRQKASTCLSPGFYLVTNCSAGFKRQGLEQYNASPNQSSLYLSKRRPPEEGGNKGFL